MSACRVACVSCELPSGPLTHTCAPKSRTLVAEMVCLCGIHPPPSTQEPIPLQASLLAGRAVGRGADANLRIPIESTHPTPWPWRWHLAMPGCAAGCSSLSPPAARDSSLLWPLASQLLIASGSGGPWWLLAAPLAVPGSSSLWPPAREN